MLIRLLQTSAVLTALFSIATLFNSLHAWLELFSHFRMQYLVCGALLAIALAVLRQRNFAIGMLLLTVLNTSLVAPWYISNDANNNPGPTRIRIMQANVLGHSNEPATMLAYINAERPDIIFLQEVTDVWVRALSSIEARYPYSVAVPRNDSFGIAVYARAPLLDTEIIEGPADKLPSLLVHQELQGRRVTFLTTHPYPPLGAAMTAGRNEQLQSIAERLAAIDGPRVLVGDLNTSMWAHHYKELEESAGIRNARRGFGALPTWPSQLFPAAIPIDHCLVSEEFAVLDFRIGPDNGSDHLPLVVELAL